MAFKSSIINYNVKLRNAIFKEVGRSCLLCHTDGCHHGLLKDSELMLECGNGGSRSTETRNHSFRSQECTQSYPNSLRPKMMTVKLSALQVELIAKKIFLLMSIHAAMSDIMNLS